MALVRSPLSKGRQKVHRSQNTKGIALVYRIIFGVTLSRDRCASVPFCSRFDLLPIVSLFALVVGQRIQTPPVSTIIMEPKDQVVYSPRSRPRRVKQSSSLSGMMLEGEPAPSTPPLSPSFDKSSDSELQDIARRLRRTKRSLLLKSVEPPASPVDQFRNMVLKLSSEDAPLPFRPNLN